jgi:hypothetical protein
MRVQTTHDTMASVPNPSVQRPPTGLAAETHSAAALRLVLQALAEHGCDLAAETAALGLSLDEVRDIEGRIPRSAYCALWQRLADVTGDPDCGLHLACRLPTGALGVIEYVASNPRTREPITVSTQIPSGSQFWVCNPGAASCTQSPQAYLCGPTICYCDGVIDCLDLWWDCPSNYTFDCGWDVGQCICVDPQSN